MLLRNINPRQGLCNGQPGRVVGVESAVFLATQLNNLRPHLASLVDNSQAVDISGAVDLRTPVYLATVYHSLAW